MMCSFLLGPIVGGLSHKSAYLWARLNAPGVLHAWLGRQPDLSDAFLVGRSLPAGPETGFAGVAPVGGLAPETRYHYALTLNETPPPSSAAPYPAFTTFPRPGRPVPFSFAFGSCFRPADENGGQIFNAIEALRRRAQPSPENALRFILMLGDQIYADCYKNNSLGKIACSLEDYRAVYAYTWSRPALRRLLLNLPAFMTLDDHEVDDDWRWTDSTRRVACIPWWDRLQRFLQGRSLDERCIPVRRVQDALEAYWEHQGMHSPGFEMPPDLDPNGRYALYPQDPGSLAYTFTYGAAAFFVLDTRSMRVRGRGGSSMLGDGQWRALQAWLSSVGHIYPLKFVVSSCALLFRMWADIPRDRWTGYPHERDRFLGILADQGISNVYLLAGDLHSAHAMRAELYGPLGQSIPLWEFCSSPFEQSPNKIARYTCDPRRFGPLKTLERRFTIAELNFGVVRVTYNENSAPQVRFEVYGEQGQLLNQAGEQF